jgi:4'-phosphopantetheinyl transferase
VSIQQESISKPLAGPVVYLCRPESAVDPALCDQYYGLLDAEERRRHSQFRFDADRHTFLVSHALVRVALSRHADISPEVWRFRKNEYGRPEIDNRGELPRLRFNLSHSRGLVGCVISEEFDAGIDIENVATEIDVLSVADRVCSSREMALLNSLPEATRLSRFLAIWTLKEAYSKARGMGFFLPFHRFTIEIGEDCIRAHFDPEMAEDPNEWMFTLFKPTEDHYLAIAARSARTSHVKVSSQWFLPLKKNHRVALDPVMIP